jgi:hypothetical protein
MRWLGLILLASGIWLIVDGHAVGVALILAAFGIWAFALALSVFRAQRSADEPVTASDGRPRRRPIPWIDRRFLAVPVRPLTVLAMQKVESSSPFIRFENSLKTKSDEGST